MSGPSRLLGVALLVGLACTGEAQQGTRSARAVRELVESGRLADAEAMARAGGLGLSVPLGEVLLLRGRIAPAESAFSAAIRGRLPDRRSAEAALAELADEHGDRATAVRLAEALVADYERDGSRWSGEERTAAGRGYVVLGPGDPEAVRAALRAFDAAVAADSGALTPRLRLGDLFLDKYNAPEARASYTAALRLVPGNARALLGLARVLAFEGNSDAMDTVRKSLAANPALAPADLLLGKMHLDAEEYDSAAAAAARALATDSSSVDGWALLGATTWLRGDTAGFARARSQAQQAHPWPAAFFSEVAEAAARHRRYAEAVGFGREAVAIDSTSSRALGVLGINELRVGEIAQGRAYLERAFAQDPFHIWYKNTLDLLDELNGFRTISTPRFRVVAPAAEADLLGLYLGPLLEEAYDSLAARYEYRPPTPIRIELFRRHADFSVRTVGLTGMGALGASFGTVLVMDAPSARDPGSFNWGSTAWHELAHTFTLGLSAHRVPRWLSEGLSVLEERRARQGWGAGPSVEFLAAFKAGKLLPVSRLNEGFVRPSHPAEIGFSYYQASLVCEMIEQRWGRAALVAMLRAYRDGRDTPAVFAEVLGVTQEALVKEFAAWLGQRFAGPLGALAPWDGKGPARGEFVTALKDGKALLEAGRLEEARVTLERAAQLFPDYTGPGAPPILLARVYQAQGNDRKAAEALGRYSALDEAAWDANAAQAQLLEELSDWRGVLVPLERMLWISPYDAGLHTRLADAAERVREFARAVRERRAALALGPSDPLEARYQLARTLAEAGDATAARREILQVLEAAPGFEKAQALLLELKRRNPRGSVP